MPRQMTRLLLQCIDVDEMGCMAQGSGFKVHGSGFVADLVQSDRVA